MLRFGYTQLVFFLIGRDTNRITGLQSGRYNQLRKSVFQIILNGTLQRTGAKLHIVAFGSKESLGFIIYNHLIANGFNPFIQTFQLYVHNLRNGIQRKLVKRYDFIQTVQELRSKGLVQCFLNHTARVLVIIRTCLCRKTYATTELFQLAGTDIGGHDDDCILKVNRSAIIVSKTSLIQHLQQDIEHIRVSFFNFVQQHYGIRFPAYLLSQLSAFLITDIPTGTPDATVAFSTVAQPIFHKNFDLVAESFRDYLSRNYTLYICSDSLKQTDRIRAIFEDRGDNISFTPVERTLHEGFADDTLRLCIFTDHQLFDRFHKYNLKSDKARSGKVALSLKELNQFTPGDYVVHIDHGIGRFGGLTKIDNDGKIQEAIRLVYKNNSELYVSLHSLHKISKYKGKDGEPPTVSKLGGEAWNKLKQRTKSRVKDIARELIALYAKRRREEAYAFSKDSFLQDEMEASFMYEETPDQMKAIEAVKADMESPHVMDRLVCGDVGFGKTEVAIRAAFKAVADSKQVAVLVPTTVLAYQHYNTFKKRLEGMPCRIEYISRMKKSADIKRILKDLEAGKVDIIIGTHRLTSNDIKFKDLGLLVIDEEQKFGVAVKEKLKRLKLNVDTITMTATPIPRTLQFSLMGARDMSIIRTAPPNRYPIVTELHRFDEKVIKDAISYEVSRGGQVFFIHNRVDNIRDIQYMIHRLIPGIKSCVGHGQMSGEELETVMHDFVRGDYDVLIATTIVESGLDIPNANTIIINQAQNYGLSDLHQLRGRVGRSNRKAFCYLLAPPLELVNADARRRLKAIEDFSGLGSGFNIAMQDLDIRGAGNILGGEQSGFIAEVGYETYQRILNEALVELRDEEFPELQKVHPDEPMAFATDCVIDTDFALLIPDTYVENVSERIRLYRELDNIANEEALQRFEIEMKDRFGEIPAPVVGLMEVVRIRQRCIDLGIERLMVKNNKMVVYFISDQNSPFYASPVFSELLKFIQKQVIPCKISEKNDKLSLVFTSIADINRVSEITREMRDFAYGNN